MKKQFLKLLSIRFILLNMKSIKKYRQFYKIMKMKILSIVLVLSIFPISVSAQDVLVFSTAENSKMSGLAQNILKKAYNSIGIEIEIRELPASRAIYMANRGDLDGELMRVQGIEKKYANLIQIPVGIARIDGVVFTKSLDIQVDGFESLSPYSIAIRRGVKFAEDGTAGMNRTISESLEHAFLLLDKGRIDVVIATRFTGLSVLNKFQYQEISVLEPPLITTNLYHYLHYNKKALVPKITAILEKMRNDGVILEEQERFSKEFLKKLNHQ